jgi:isoquinoline 1-oxidoreductase beta subunit
LAACPVLGGSLRKVDPAPALAVEGVKKVLPLPGAVIVLADHYWAAQTGLLALAPEWDYGPDEALDDAAIGAALNRALQEGGVTVAANDGAEDLLAAPDETVIEARYEVPYLAHATMEPMNATAHVRDDGVEIWAPTQSPGIARFVVAGALSIDPASVTVHSTFLGGGFGRRSESDFVLYAVEASRAAGVPVMVVWSREEDTRHDFYRTRAAARLAARLDRSGAITAWHGRYACQSIMARLRPEALEGGVDDTSLEGALDLPYRLGGSRNDYARVETGLPVGFWRSPGHNQNAFFTESFIDELAHHAGLDGVAFRLRLLTDKPRHRKVLERAAEMIDWHQPAAPGVHRGIALHEAHGSIVAEGVEIGWEPERKIRIRRISCAIDCGLALNPDTIEAQMESGIVYGLTAALWGEINVTQGRVVQGNFNDCRALRLPEMPPIDVAIIEGGDRPGGVGEPGTPPIAPALASAVFAASGERIRTLPFARHGITLA